MHHISAIFSKTLEKGAIEIDERENVQDIFIVTL